MVLTGEARQEFRIIRMQANGYSLVEICECCMLQLGDTDGCDCGDRGVPCVAAEARAQFWPGSAWQIMTEGTAAGFSRLSCELCSDSGAGDRFEGWVKELGESCLGMR